MLKNALIAILALCTIAGGYYLFINTVRIAAPGARGTTAKVHRGDLTLPITATGSIRPSRRVEIKAEASGEVIEIGKYAGDRVRKGDLLILLNPVDEQRSVSRANHEVAIGEAQLADLKLALEQAETADLNSAKAKILQLEPGIALAKFRYEKILGLEDHQRNEEEVLQRRTTLASQKAQLDAAKAGLKRAELAVPRARQAIKQTEARVAASKDTLEDAKKRLAKTRIVSPIDGIVGDLRVQIGEVIQGGKSTITGGTVLAVIQDIDRILVRAEVDEADIAGVLDIAPPWAKPGNDGSTPMPVDVYAAAATMDQLPEIGVEAFREETFQGVIERIHPEPRTISNVVTFVVDVVITSDNRAKLLAGMRADVEFTAQHVSGVILCPNEAIREGPTGKLGVYVPEKDAVSGVVRAKFVACRFGLDNGAYSEVREGLSEGDVVFTKVPAKLQDDERDKR